MKQNLEKRGRMNRWTAGAFFLSFIIGAAAFLNAAAGVSAESSVPAAGNGQLPVAWDGKTVDVSWYNTADTEFHISTAAQLAGLAAIVNGQYNREIHRVIGDPSVIVNHESEAEIKEGSQNRSTSVYHYGEDDFNGKTVYLDADLDMGGSCDPVTGEWGGPNYMPVGGQYLMVPEDSSTKLSSSFNGTLDGQGHVVANIYCDRYCGNGNFGDGQSVGLVGRLGCHDNDPFSMWPQQPAVRNVVVSGYIKGNRSVGGIVGKIGKNVEGAVISQCANFAEIRNTDAKGIGGIAGAGWNGGVIENCYHAGSVSSSYSCPSGGISGSNENTIRNCYSYGKVEAVRDSFAMAIGTNNGGGNDVDNCFWLSGSAPGGGYYGKTNGTVTEQTEEQLKSVETLELLGTAFTADTAGINHGYPVLVYQKSRTEAVPAPPAPEDVSKVNISAFRDVRNDDWFYAAVQYAVGNGLFRGTSEETFEPQTPMSRAMFVTVLGRLDGADASQYEGSSFMDVPEGMWFSPYVQWAVQHGIVSGVGEGKFNPEGMVTREQIAAILYRYQNNNGVVMRVQDPERVSGFTDWPSVSGWSRDAVAWMVGNHYLNGSAGLLEPSGSATRAQVAQIIRNYDGLFS